MHTLAVEQTDACGLLTFCPAHRLMGPSRFPSLNLAVLLRSIFRVLGFFSQSSPGIPISICTQLLGHMAALCTFMGLFRPGSSNWGPLGSFCLLCVVLPPEPGPRQDQVLEFIEFCLLSLFLAQFHSAVCSYRCCGALGLPGAAVRAGVPLGSAGVGVDVGGQTDLV